MTECSICGDLLNNQFKHKLVCGHEFHYECLLKSFKSMKNNDCPYCRKEMNILPLVNGIKKIDLYLHDLNEAELYENKMCNAILTKGKNKGNQCGAHCKLGYFQCKRHLKS